MLSSIIQLLVLFLPLLLLFGGVLTEMGDRILRLLLAEVFTKSSGLKWREPMEETT